MVVRMSLSTLAFFYVDSSAAFCFGIELTQSFEGELH